MMLQYNISFDTYFGRLIDPNSYKILSYLSTILGKNAELSPNIFNNIFDLVDKYVEKLDPNNKSEYKQNMYFIISSLFIKLKEINREIGAILTPIELKDYITLRCYLLPLLDLMAEIHPNAIEPNSFAYQYIINDEVIDIEKLYILENENESSAQIVTINPNKFKEYIEKKQLSINISGALLYKHEAKVGILNEFLDNRLEMREKYKDERDKYPVGTEEYKFFDRRQLSCKVNANSSYGVSGLSSFRFSNKWLAKSITLSGKLCLKTSQVLGEAYFRNLEENGS